MMEELGMQAYFKKEYMQYTGSFKERGARYTLVKMEEEQKGSMPELHNSLLQQHNLLLMK